MAVISKTLPGHEVISIILQEMVRLAKPGIKTIDIDRKAEELIETYGAKSYNKNYAPTWSKAPYPFATCINVNSTIAHGFPSEYVLKEGDIVSFDLGIIDSQGNCADAAITVPIGEIPQAKKRLLYYAYQTMMVGVNLLIPGANTETIARQINQYAALRGYKVNRKFAGHSIGKEMHEKPNIYNTVEASHIYAILNEGQVFCVEPMLTNGREEFGIADVNGWTFRTGDNMPSAFFEVMVKVTNEGPIVLTDHIKNIPSL